MDNLTKRQEVGMMKKLIERARKENKNNLYLKINDDSYLFFFDDEGRFAFGSIETSSNNEYGEPDYVHFESMSFLYYRNVRLDDLSCALLAAAVN